MIRVATPADFDAILSLNLEWEHVLSPMGPERLHLLHGMADYHRVLESEGQLMAFLLAFREEAAYDSSNYRWFAERYSEFFYIDRIVVASACQGLGLGARLYQDLFQVAVDADCPLVACEFDIDPPNDASRAFHERLGFRQVGAQRDPNTGKTVAYQIASLPK